MHRAVGLFYNRLFRCFVPYLWEKHVHPIVGLPPESPTRHFAVLVIRNACVETALMGLRDLDDFFRPRQSEDGADALRAVTMASEVFARCFLPTKEQRSTRMSPI